ncbi:MAG: polyprenyl synthetase family protein [Fimbriimonadaceae bacterium]|nr:polyprenyl synthetase family protein [Fimbriimonadaceae bacterium]
MSASRLFELAQGQVEPGLMAQLGRHVAAVEAELARQMGSQVRLVEEVGTHTLRAGGKRLRPALVAIVAEVTGRPYDPARAARLGACLEMIHMATLIHDDVIDHADTRRGAATAAAVFGNTAAILSGDVLLAKAMSLLAHDGDLAIIRLVADMVVEMAEGEVRELETRGEFDLSANAHREIIRMKTAEFIRSCCQVGALLAGLATPEVESLGAYGYHIGMAFQIVDDLLDYEAETATLGKQTATDFREGCATYPLIFLRDHLTEAERTLAETKFGNGVTDEEICLIREWMRERGAFAETRALASDHVRLARARLEDLPDGPGRAMLGAIAEFIVQRRS